MESGLDVASSLHNFTAGLSSPPPSALSTSLVLFVCLYYSVGSFHGCKLAMLIAEGEYSVWFLYFWLVFSSFLAALIGKTQKT